MLEGKGVSFRYPGSQAMVLHNVSLAVAAGERVGVMASSGFGKTTLCKLLAGYETPTAGQVLLDGQPLPQTGYNPVQMIWQHPELSVNPRLVMAQTLAEGDKIAPEVLEGLGILPRWLWRYPQELSGGELQRFCIARALGARTQFILADEISAMLDWVTQSQLWHFIIAETERRKIGLLAVSHQKALLEKICTRIIRLDGEVER